MRPRFERFVRDERGFGLIEMTIALTMLAIAISALGGLFVTGHLALRRAAESDTASVLADRVLERFRAETWDNIALSDELMSSVPASYTSDAAYSLDDQITMASGDGPCGGTDPSGGPACWPSRSIPDTSQTPPEVAPDGNDYTVDSYVDWGCAPTSGTDTLDTGSSPPVCTVDAAGSRTAADGSPLPTGTEDAFAQVKVVTVVVHDSNGKAIYRTSSSFDRLTGGSMPTVTVGASGDSADSGDGGSGGGPAPDAPTGIAIANGGGTNSVYINSGNATSLSFDVTVDSNSLATDTVTLKLSDGNSAHDQTLTASAPQGAGVVHFTNINGQAFADGAITVTATAKNSGGTSDAFSQQVTKDTTAPAAPTLVSLANGLGTGNQYINISNAGSVSLTVGLDGSTVSGDTVNARLVKGASSTSLVTTPAPVGGGIAGNITISAINATGFGSYTGNVTAGASVTDAAGNTSAETTATVKMDTVAPSAPTSVALANGVGSGNAYINSTNVSSVTGKVGLGSTSVGTDTVNFWLGDGTTTTGSGNAAGTAGSGTVTTTGVTATVLSQGSITASAKVVDAAGNTSTTTTATFTKDTTAPTVSSVTLVNATGNTAGMIEQNDQIKIVFSKTMAVASLCTGWTGDGSNQTQSGNGTVVATLTDGTGSTNDKLSLVCGSINLGTIDLGSNAYVSSGSPTFSGNGSNASVATWTASSHTLTITLGKKSSSGTVATVASSTAVYTPGAAVTSGGLNAVSGTGSPGSVKNF